MSVSTTTTDGSAQTSQAVSFTLNGDEVAVRVDPDRTLLSVLREDLGIISPKNGCEPQASCGCCTVLIDGKPRLACAMKTRAAQGRSVVTAEGLDPELRTQIAESFVRAGGVQCGFCIPGFVMRTVATLEQNPQPTRDELARAFRPHLCRCTGYKQILDAAELLARVRRGEAPPPPDASGKVGGRLDRYRGAEFVLGDFRYVDDIQVDGALFAAMRFSDHPRALVKAIDPAPALAIPGVHRVITAADVPGERYVGLIVSDWPVLVAIGEETRCVGDILAIVVAENQQLAREAAAAIRIDYEVRSPVTDPYEALKPDAPQIHPNGNLLSRSRVKRGDVDAVLASSAHVVDGTYSTQRIEHMFLEPEACIAIPGGAGEQGTGEGTGLRVLSQGQGVFDDRRQIASILGWPVERVQVELISNGGAFGGKEDMSIQGQTALAAALVGRPVKCTLTREESFRLHPKRHPIRIEIKAGCDEAGRLTAVRARMIGDKGAYASVGAKVLERAAGHAVGPYRVQAVDIEALAVYTNNPPCGAMRGFGANQAAFAVERCLDRLAREVGIDGWEMRSRNILEPGDTFCTGQKLDKPFGLRRTLEAVKDIYRSAKYAGIACGIKNVGIGNGMPDEGKTVMRVEAADRVSIRTGFTEMGQGYFTILIQTAANETGLPPGVFHPTTDTSVDVNCGQTTASRATVLGGLATMQAARKLKADLDAGRSLADLVGREYRGEYACTYTTKPDADVPNPKTHLTYGFATQVVILNDQGAIERVVAAHDVGRVMNPTLLEGQMQGSIHMGLGYALTEEFPCEGGRPTFDSIKSLNVLRAHQMPQVDCIFIEQPDPETAYGSRGVGEIGLVPTAPAVAGALEAFDGVHRTDLPMKDSPAARAILKPRRA
ncbi:MAG: selenium-dependent xanthine dehydrogenase [Planctomycetota bacterium]|nr:MAG: selenium-dependent xanthine dehydrogenase [Planctomycetota bacterium]